MESLLTLKKQAEKLQEDIKVVLDNYRYEETRKISLKAKAQLPFLRQELAAIQRVVRERQGA
jgi:hypothetical protein